MTGAGDDRRCNCTQNRPDLHGHHPRCRLYVAPDRHDEMSSPDVSDEASLSSSGYVGPEVS